MACSDRAVSALRSIARCVTALQFGRLFVLLCRSCRLRDYAGLLCWLQFCAADRPVPALNDCVVLTEVGNVWLCGEADRGSEPVLLVKVTDRLPVVGEQPHTHFAFRDRPCNLALREPSVQTLMVVQSRIKHRPVGKFVCLFCDVAH